MQCPRAVQLCRYTLVRLIVFLRCLPCRATSISYTFLKYAWSVHSSTPRAKDNFEMRKTALLMLLAWSSVGQLNSQEAEGSAEFLENVISQLRQDNFVGRPTTEIFMPTPIPPPGVPPPPPLQLSQDELSTLYDQAGTATGPLHPHPEGHPGPTGVSGPSDASGPSGVSGPSSLIAQAAQAALASHQGYPGHPGLPGHPGHPALPGHPGHPGGPVQGYYYYWYPLKEEHGATAMAAMSPAPDHRVEPLFMAVSGFIGIALVFVASVLFMPRLTKMGSSSGHNGHGAGAAAMSGTPEWRPRPTDLHTLTKLVAQAIGGKDCSARIACELGHALRGSHVDNKPLRVLEIILPPGMGKQIQLIRQSASKRSNTCNMPCKLRPNHAQKLRQNQNQKKKKLQLQASFVQMRH